MRPAFPYSYRWYLLCLLMLIQALSAVDRLALGLLTQDIKLDLSLTDTEIGALDGIAFALFFAILGIPIARWADRGHRGRIMAVTTALWSIAVTLCGAARSFVQLALSRVVAGVGEAGCDPIISSLLPDYFDRTERARAMTISGFYNPLATMLGYGLAGWIGQHYGWRLAFVVLGVPGLVLAILTAISVREPRSSFSSSVGTEGERREVHSLSLWRTCVALWKNASFRHLTFSDVLEEFFSYGIYAFLPAFFVRSFGMKDEELGFWFAVTNGVGGLVATYLGGELAHRFARNNEPLQLKASAILTALSTIALGGVFITHDRYIALGLLLTFIVLQMPSQGPMTAIQLTIVPHHMRAMSVAILSLVVSLMGASLGPLVGGALSDLLHPVFGEDSLRYALLILTPGYLWSAWHTWVPHRTVLHDARMAEIDSHGALAESAATQTRRSAS